MNATPLYALIGECMIELVEGGDGRLVRGFGGDSLNTAVYLARLGQCVNYVTALGDDPYSAEMLAAWAAEGVGTDLVGRLPGRLPGLHTVRTDDKGERSFFYWRSAAAARDVFSAGGAAARLSALAAHDVIYLTLISLSILDAASRDRLYEALAAARAAGARVVFDGNYRPRGWAEPQAARAVTAAILPLVDIALPSLDDERALHGDRDAAATIRRIAGEGPTEVVVKDGPGLCQIRAPEGDIVVPAEAGVAVVDTTAAGDAFNAAYLARRLAGAGPEDAARAGHRLAARVIGHRGAVIPAAAMVSFC